MSRSRRRNDVPDEYGLDEDLSVFSRGLDTLVPTPIARWALTVTVDTDKTAYDVDEPVDIRIEITNRLPVPISVRIDGKRIWGWEIDGFVEASEESLYLPETTRTLSLRAGETRTFHERWGGRIKRDGTPTRWEPVSPGDHEITAFVSTTPPREDSTTISIR